MFVHSWGQLEFILDHLYFKVHTPLLLDKMGGTIKHQGDLTACELSRVKERNRKRSNLKLDKAKFRATQSLSILVFAAMRHSALPRRVRRLHRRAGNTWQESHLQVDELDWPWFMSQSNRNVYVQNQNGRLRSTRWLEFVCVYVSSLHSYAATMTEHQRENYLR